MAKKCLGLLIMIIVLLSMVVIPTKAANPDFNDLNLVPDIITNRIIILSHDSLLIKELNNGTLGIVSFYNGKWIGFNIPYGNLYSTDILITVDTPIEIQVAAPVALKLIKGNLFVYLPKVEVIAIKWNMISIPPPPNDFEFSEPSWFPKFIPVRIVKVIPDGVETEINGCCNPPIKKISYGYKLYLAVSEDPYNPPEDIIGDPMLYLNKYFMAEIMVPDYLVSFFETIVKNKDFLWIGLTGCFMDYNYLYFWSH